MFIISRIPGNISSALIALLLGIEVFGFEESGPQAMGQSSRVLGISDGPYVFWKSESSAELVGFANGEVKRKLIQDIKEPTESLSPCGRYSVTLDPSKPKIPPVSWKSPSRILAVSDLEGNYEALLQFLKNVGLLNKEGHWNWNDGHLVCIGDMIDRGEKVTETLWLIRRLEREAEESGGRVHYVLGNHEMMVMGGDLRYVHPKYGFISAHLGMTYDELFGPETEFGRWFRTRNSVIRIGRTLFVHAGYSPQLDACAFDLTTLNQNVRDCLSPNRPSGRTLATATGLHSLGPLWYRGYFSEHQAEFGGKPTSNEIDRILTRHDVDHIVVGHTLVERVGPIEGDKRLIGIDVHWDQASSGEGLLIQEGVLSRVTMNGSRESLAR